MHLALLAKVFYNFRPRTTSRIYRFLTYNRGMTVGLFLMVIGVVLDAGLVIRWVVNDLRLAEVSHAGVFGLLLIMLGFQTITQTLILQMVLSTRQTTKSSFVTASEIDCGGRG